jgi:integrase
MAQITTTSLRGKWQGRDRWLSDGGSRGNGRLVARIARDEVHMYFRYSVGDGKTKLFPLGPYDERGERGLSLVAARNKAADLAALYRDGATDLHGHFERQRAKDEIARQAEAEAARQAAEEAQRGTLKQLLDAYVQHLDRHGKLSVNEIRNMFERHITDTALLKRKAAELTVDDFVPVIGKLVEAGKGRTAGKLRSYLRAAYALAIASKTDPEAPMTLRTFGIGANPVASIGALARFNRARDRVLDAVELGGYLKRLDALPAGRQKDALQLALYLGGQRPAQLVRLKRTDVDLSAGTVTLYDPKGRRQQARRHVLPMVKEAERIVMRLMHEGSDEPRLFGKLRAETLSNVVADISTSMVAAKEAREPFELRDIRRTAETVLASLKVSSDDRAQLQSHGLGGVQNRHYDKHSYAIEKRQALEKWARHISRLKSGHVAKVVTIIKATV